MVDGTSYSTLYSSLPYSRLNTHGTIREINSIWDRHWSGRAKEGGGGVAGRGMTSVEPMKAFCSRFYLTALEKGCEVRG